MFNKFKTSKAFKIVNGIATSAILALLLSLMFFAYDVFRDADQDKRDDEHFEKTVEQLDKISQSLSTRFLGTFPIYLTEINRILKNVQPRDTIVILEDLLYYGIKSCPNEFRQLNTTLINHAQNGGKVIIAYYDNHPLEADKPWISVFYRVALESRVSMEYIPNIKNEHRDKMLVHSRGNNDIEYAIRLDSALTEKYFAKTRDDNREKAEHTRLGYLNKALVMREDSTLNNRADTIVNKMCLKLDSIKQHYLGNGKNLNDVQFKDYLHMYSEMTDCIAANYRNENIELIPINEYLTMSCWLIKPADKVRTTEAILAFPSKYNSNEIGFYSQDASFAQYITIILAGIRGEL